MGLVKEQYLKVIEGTWMGLCNKEGIQNEGGFRLLAVESLKEIPIKMKIWKMIQHNHRRFLHMKTRDVGTKLGSAFLCVIPDRFSNVASKAFYILADSV